MIELKLIGDIFLQWFIHTKQQLFVELICCVHVWHKSYSVNVCGYTFVKLQNYDTEFVEKNFVNQTS